MNLVYKLAYNKITLSEFESVLEVNAMAITKDDLYKMIDRLSESDAASAFDYLQFLITRSGAKKNRSWGEITKLPPDGEPLSEEELRQLAAPDDYISLARAAKEYGI